MSQISLQSLHVCKLYGYKVLHDLNEARYQSYIKMTHGEEDKMFVFTTL